ncbi:MAG: hypothetical protein GY850_31325, partial [bacterium]|nr:hypothetical protein [bacterium]MCP4627976.1 hypothetical protein [bacterium]
RPGHKDARAIQKLLDREAKRLYEEGYTLEVINPEQAIKKWEEVLKISSPGSPYHKKAKAKLAKY